MDLTVEFIKKALKNLKPLKNLIDSLTPVLDFLDVLNYRYLDDGIESYYNAERTYKEILSALFEVNPPLKLFTPRSLKKRKNREENRHYDFRHLLYHPEARNISLLSFDVNYCDSDKYHPGAKNISLCSEDFDSKDLKIKYFLIDHPRATEFPEFQKLFNPELEGNSDIRIKSYKRWIENHPEKKQR